MIRTVSAKGFVTPSEQCLDASTRGGADRDNGLVDHLELAATQACSRSAQELCPREKVDGPRDHRVAHAKACIEIRD
jgi:hypothetical protein